MTEFPDKRDLAVGSETEKRLLESEVSLQKALEEIKKSESKLRQVIDTIPTLAWCNLPDGPNEFLSKRWHEYTGLSPEESHGWGWQVAFHPEDLPSLMKRWQELLVSGEPGEIESRIRRHDGEYRWFLIRVEPLRDETGKIHRWYGTSTDIEDRKRAEEQLRRGKAFLVEGQRLSQTGTFSWRVETGEIRWSEELYRIFDFTSDLPVTLELIGSRVHPEDLPMLGEMIDRAKRGDDQFAYEHRIVMPGGSTKYIHLIGHAVRDAAGHVEYFGAAHDITQRRIAEQALEASEQNLSMIINTIPALAWSARSDGEAEFFNQRWLDYTGMTSTQAEGSGWKLAIHPNDLDRMVNYWQAAVTTGEPVEIEARLRRFDGAFRWFLFRAQAVRDDSGAIVKWYGTNTDIDDLKHTHEQLRRSEAFLVEGQRLSRTGTYSWRPDTNEITWSKELYRIFEIDPDTPASLELTLTRIHPDDIPSIREVETQGQKSPDDYEHSFRILLPDGRIKFVHVMARATRDYEGRPEFFGAAQDITQRRIAEEALEASERNLKTIINTIPTLAWSARPDGSADFFNQHYLDYIGLPSEKLEGWGWTIAVHPEDLNALSGAWQFIMAAGKPGEAEARLRRFDGEFRWFLFRANPMRDESGQIVKWYGTNTDINDRKRAEAQVKESYLRLAEAQQLSKTGSFITDLVADDHNWSEETFRIFEFDPRAKISVQMIRNRIHPEDLPSFDSMIARAMTGNDVDFSFRFVTSRGALKHIRGMARVIEHVVGRPLFIGALQDVTDSKVAEEALNRARSELAHVSRVTTLNALTASIAHEINQPLSGIITNANTCLLMLSDDPPDVEGARETTQRTIRDGNRASDVINRLRALYSKKDSRPEPMDLNEATREVVSLSLSDLQRNRVILIQELADDLPRVAADRIQLQQVILNLLRNGSDAMRTVDDRARELLIKTERQEDNRVRFSVKDVGVGLQPQAADKLFEAFYTTKYDGMGIGLHVSHSIIEAHHGRLWATANEGHGATFSFAIPSVV